MCAVKADVIKDTTSYYGTPTDVGRWYTYIYVNWKLFIDPIRLHICMEMVTSYMVIQKIGDMLMGIYVVGWISLRFKPYYSASKCKLEFAIYITTI